MMAGPDMVIDVDVDLNVNTFRVPQLCNVFPVTLI